jgi:hypothetical protein
MMVYLHPGPGAEGSFTLPWARNSQGLTSSLFTAFSKKSLLDNFEYFACDLGWATLSLIPVETQNRIHPVNFDFLLEAV